MHTHPKLAWPLYGRWQHIDNNSKLPSCLKILLLLVNKVNKIILLLILKEKSVKKVLKRNLDHIAFHVSIFFSIYFYKNSYFSIVGKDISKMMQDPGPVYLEKSATFYRAMLLGHEV